jgi:signal transduction histidine kinase
MPPRPNTQDAVLAGVLTLWAVAEVVLGDLDGPTPINLVAAVITPAVLTWRRSAPLLVGLASAGGLALKTAAGSPNEGLALNIALLVAAYSVGRHSELRRALLTIPAMIVLAWISLLGLPDADQSVSNYPFIAIWLGAPAAAGAAFRFQLARAADLADRAARAEMQREEHAREAVAEERGRIARELHDTVAHAVSVMVLHSGAVRSRLPEELASEKEALGQVEDTGRLAIAELRRMLGVLRSKAELAATEPQPTLDQLDRVVEAARAEGLAVDVVVEGRRRALEPALEVSAYRILQEALTNIRKHARASSVSIRLTYEDAWVRLHVQDDGIGCDGRDDEGFGLLGIRERVEVYGGSLSLGSGDDGGFALDAALPVQAP